MAQAAVQNRGPATLDRQMVITQIVRHRQV